MRPPLNYMMLHTGTLAGEFNAILNYRAIFGSLVLSGGLPAGALTDEAGSGLTDESGTVLTDG